ncbi:hypothetical protein PFISCL1PPCAC_3844, partial [Pristionchus fissidentatus]
LQFAGYVLSPSRRLIMSDISHGLVVEKHDAVFAIWRLFRGCDSGIMSLDESMCINPAQIGDVVQAKSRGNSTSIQTCWPYPDSIFSEANRIIVRTIISYDRVITIDKGKWLDDDSRSVLLVSHDLGLVSVPIQWYTREMQNPGECHLLAYVEFLPRFFVSARNRERVEYFWRVVEGRLCLPVSPPDVENLSSFTQPDEIRAVPACVVARLDNSHLLWSYALGHNMALLRTDERLAVGHWLMVTVVPGTDTGYRDYCKYTAVHYEDALPYSQPELRVEGGKITMTLTLTRSVADHDDPHSEVQLWHEFYGLRVNFDEGQRQWIRSERREFRGLVEISLDPEENDERRVFVKAVGPAAMPRLGKMTADPFSPITPVLPVLPTRPTPAAAAAGRAASFENMYELKAALLQERRQQTSERTTISQKRDEWAAPVAPTRELQQVQQPQQTTMTAGGWRSGVKGVQTAPSEQTTNNNVADSTPCSAFARGNSHSATMMMTGEKNNNESTGGYGFKSPAGPTVQQQTRDCSKAAAVAAPHEAPKNAITAQQEAWKKEHTEPRKAEKHVVHFYNWEDEMAEETEANKLRKAEGWERMHRVLTTEERMEETRERERRWKEEKAEFYRKAEENSAELRKKWEMEKNESRQEKGERERKEKEESEKRERKEKEERE